jgi:hypothetical protein
MEFDLTTSYQNAARQEEKLSKEKKKDKKRSSFKKRPVCDVSTEPVTLTFVSFAQSQTVSSSRLGWV